jgi:hypothetical protein
MLALILKLDFFSAIHRDVEDVASDAFLAALFMRLFKKAFDHSSEAT